MRTPLMLLDVDGVLNAVGSSDTGRRTAVFAGYTLSWDPTVTRRLADWHAQGRVEVQWLTTWAGNADALLAEPMGLPRGLRVHERSDGEGPSGFTGALAGARRWGKLDAARAVADEDPGRRIVWVDDDLALQADDVQAWLAEHPHVLPIAPTWPPG